jgi:SAM-dependent methyltransferase
LSSDEARRASRFIEDVYIEDLDATHLKFLRQPKFDLIIASHVLEHLKNPIRLVSLLAQRLEPRGQLLIAIPNVLTIKNRWRFACGRFEYEESAVMDRTHLRFFTWHTADRYLVNPVVGLTLVTKVAEGAAPLWFLRQILPKNLTAALDQGGTRLFPNLFGNQVILDARASKP